MIFCLFLFHSLFSSSSFSSFFFFPRIRSCFVVACPRVTDSWPSHSGHEVVSVTSSSLSSSPVYISLGRVALALSLCRAYIPPVKSQKEITGSAPSPALKMSSFSLYFSFLLFQFLYSFKNISLLSASPRCIVCLI